MKVIKVPLSNQGMSELLKKINNLKNDLQKLDENIVNKTNLGYRNKCYFCNAKISRKGIFEKCF